MNRGNDITKALKCCAQQAVVRTILLFINGLFACLEILSRTRFSSGPPKNIIVLRTAALGDFMMSLPALRRLRAAFPESKITLLTTSTTDRSTLRTVEKYTGGENPWLQLLTPGTVDEIITFSAHSWRDLVSNSLGEFSFKQYDSCFILGEGMGPSVWGTAKKIPFLRLLGVRCRIFGVRLRACPTLFPLVQVGPHRLEHHVVALMRSLEENVQVASTPYPEIFFKLATSTDAETWIKKTFATLDVSKSDLIVIAPGSRLEFKRWPAENFVHLILGLLALPKIKIVLVGSGPEVETVDAVYSMCAVQRDDMSRVINLGGNTSIPNLAALFNHSAVFIGNDGGACHLAIAAGCLVVSIANGAEIPNSVEPWGCQKFTARHTVPCAPCYCFTHCPRGDSACVTGITPIVVRKLVDEALRLRRQGAELAQ